MQVTTSKLITEEDILKSNRNLKKLPEKLPFKFILNDYIYTTPAAEGLPVVEYCVNCNARYLFMHPTVLVTPYCPYCGQSLHTIGPTKSCRNNPLFYLGEWNLDEKDIEVIKSVYRKYTEPVPEDEAEWEKIDELEAEVLDI